MSRDHRSSGSKDHHREREHRDRDRERERERERDRERERERDHHHRDRDRDRGRERDPKREKRDHRDHERERRPAAAPSGASVPAAVPSAASSVAASSAAPVTTTPKPQRGLKAGPAAHRDPPDMGWYFTKQELAKSPSVSSTMSDAQVRVLQAKALEFLQKTGMALRLPQLTIATAVVYFQRFYVVFSLKKYDLFKVAAAALFLAGKVEETPKKLKEVLCKAWELDPRRKPQEIKDGLAETAPDFVALKEKILEYERELLRVVAFNLAVDHPYKYLLQSVKTVGGSKDMALFAWNFINDSLKTNLCLQYKPQVVGCAVLDLTSKAMKVKLPGPPEQARWWYEEAPYNARPEQLEDVCDQLLSLYEGFNNVKGKATVGERLNDPSFNSKILSVGATKGSRDALDDAMGTGGTKRERTDEGGVPVEGGERKRPVPPPPPPPPPPPAQPQPPAHFQQPAPHHHGHPPHIPSHVAQAPLFLQEQWYVANNLRWPPPHLQQQVQQQQQQQQPLPPQQQQQQGHHH